MASKIYLLRNYNNYYNRVIKRYDSINDYINNYEYAVRGTGSIPSIETGRVCNFTINDGVTSEITYNYDPNQTWQPDYVVVENVETQELSRWFVMESIKTRKGQFRLNLRRDVIADHYNEVITAPTFIEKATLDKSNNFIFNTENMTYNQIKSDNEILLKDETNTPWIVGYVAKPQSNESDTVITGNLSKPIDIYATNTTSSNYLSSLNQGIIINDLDAYMSVEAEGETLYNYIYKYSIYVGLDVSSRYLDRDTSGRYWREKGSASSTRNNMRNVAISNNLGNLMKAAISSTMNYNVLTTSQYEELRSMNGNIVKCSDGLFRIDISTYNSHQLAIPVTASGNYSSLYTAFDNVLRNSFGISSNYTGGKPTTYSVSYNNPILVVKASLTSIDKPEYSYTTNIKASRRIVYDSPYCMFAIPYNSITFVSSDNTEYVTSSDVSIATAFSIAEQLTQSKCYDLQLLPYCPRRDLISSDGKINLTSSDIYKDVDYQYIVSSDSSSSSTPLGLILWCTYSSGSFNIAQSIDVPIDSLEFKVENETTFYRLNSPNYAASFEFKPTMNDGVKFFNVDYTYKPYQPYIHINPDFNRLYGRDTDDTRGLICAGDFCLPQTSDAYSSYVINNKNYQASFDRQIENMGIMHKYDMVDQGISAVLGAAQAGVTAGLGFGQMLGGSTGAITGGIAGITSLGAGISDLAISQAKYNETIDYTKDQFGFNLGNIQARPDTLNKVSAYNINNKVFPFLEKYTCSEQEKEALRNKLKYNGMTVGVIGTISDYLQSDLSYIKGKLIRLEDLSDDFHMTNEIASEINKGVFIK